MQRIWIITDLNKLSQFCEAGVLTVWNSCKEKTTSTILLANKKSEEQIRIKILRIEKSTQSTASKVSS